MLSRRVWSRATPATVLMMTTRISLGCLLDDMMVRPVALAQLHRHRRQTSLFLLYLSGCGRIRLARPRRQQLPFRRFRPGRTSSSDSSRLSSSSSRPCSSSSSSCSRSYLDFCSMLLLLLRLHRHSLHLSSASLPPLHRLQLYSLVGYRVRDSQLLSLLHLQSRCPSGLLPQ